jgi:glycosyltransferase involved in cell wall biosynthesis
MRILVVIERFIPVQRAEAHLYHDLAKGLIARGHRVDVVTKRATTYLAANDGQLASAPSREQVDGINIRRVHGLSSLSRNTVIRGLDQLLMGFTFAWAARGMDRPDVLLIYCPPLPSVMISGCWSRWLRTVPYVINLHDIYPQTAVELGLLKNSFAIGAAKLMEHIAYRNAARIVVPTPTSREILIKSKGVPSDRVGFVQNWVNTDSIVPGPKENGFRARHGLSGKFVVSFAGVMGFAQDLGGVIEAARALQDYHNMVFLLAGDGVHRLTWQRAAQGLRNVKFLPVQRRDDYLDLLQASDVCLAPLVETLKSPAIPGKIQNIMAVARPTLAIVNVDGDTAKLIEHSGSGFVVPPAAVQDIVARIQQLYHHPEIGIRLGQNGREYAIRHFSLSSAVDSYESILQSVVDQRRSQKESIRKRRPPAAEEARSFKIFRIMTRMNVGGPAQHAVFLNSGLDREGLQNRLIVGKTDAHEGNMSFFARRYGVSVTEIESLANGRGPVDDIRAFLNLYRIIRKEKPDIVHLHLLKARLLGGIAAKLAGAVHIVETFHGNLFRGYYGRVKTALIVAAERVAGWLVMDRVVALSESQRRELIGHRICPPSNIRVIPLGLDLKRFTGCSRFSGELRKELGLSPNTVLLGAIGRLVPIKGIDYLLSAAELVFRSTHTDFCLLIVGDGQLRKRLESRVAAMGLDGKIRFLGWRFDLERIYADLDIVVLSSLNEGTPVCLLEAMAAGKAIVATDVGGVPDLVEDGRTGLLVPPKSSLALARAIIHYLQNPELRERIGSYGRDSVYPKYDISTLVANTKSFYLELMGLAHPMSMLLSSRRDKCI